jgi:hypothetical protein
MLKYILLLIFFSFSLGDTLNKSYINETNNNSDSTNFYNCCNKTQLYLIILSIIFFSIIAWIYTYTVRNKYNHF